MFNNNGTKLNYFAKHLSVIYESCSDQLVEHRYIGTGQPLFCYVWKYRTSPTFYLCAAEWQCFIMSLWFFRNAASAMSYLLPITRWVAFLTSLRSVQICIVFEIVLYLTFRLFQHTSAEVTAENSNYLSSLFSLMPWTKCRANQLLINLALLLDFLNWLSSWICS